MPMFMASPLEMAGCPNSKAASKKDLVFGQMTHTQRVPRKYLNKGTAMTDSRRKGAAFERDCCALLRVEFPDRIGIKRNLDQYQTAGLADINLDPFVIECKRYQKGNWHHPDWWSQVSKAASETSFMRDGDEIEAIPILFYRFDRQPMRIVLPMKLFGYPGEETATVTATMGVQVMRFFCET